MTEQELREIEKRFNAATPGEWRRGQREHGSYSVESYRGKGVSCVVRMTSHVDAELIAMAHNQLPMLIKTIRRLVRDNLELVDELVTTQRETIRLRSELGVKK